MTYKSLPQDLQRHVRRAVYKRVIPFVLLFVGLGLILLLFGNTLFRTDVKPFRYSCYLLVMLVPFAVTGVPFKLIDRSWSGEIIKVDFDTRVVAISTGKLHARTESVIWLTVKTKEGKIIRREARVYSVSPFRIGMQHGEVPRGKIEHVENEYRVGDTVYHFYGLETLLAVREEKSDFTRCLVCAQKNLSDRETCWACGHSLLWYAPEENKQSNIRKERSS